MFSLTERSSFAKTCSSSAEIKYKIMQLQRNTRDSRRSARRLQSSSNLTVTSIFVCRGIMKRRNPFYGPVFQIFFCDFSSKEEIILKTQRNSTIYKSNSKYWYCNCNLHYQSKAEHSYWRLYSPLPVTVVWH